MDKRSLALVAAVLACAFVGAGNAQDSTSYVTPKFGELPAVSALNGKFALSGGAEGGPNQSTAVGLASGSLTAPLGHAFGLQFDADASTGAGTFGGSGTAHLFWRDPAIGLVGSYVSIEGGPNGHFARYAGEGELYAGLLTIAASAGYVDMSGVAASRPIGTPSGGFYTGRLTGYPMPDLALTAGLISVRGHLGALGGFEFQPTFGRQHNVSFFVNAEAGEQSSYAVLAGIRFYFGADKTLIRRHREDDPPDPSSDEFWVYVHLCGCDA